MLKIQGYRDIVELYTKTKYTIYKGTREAGNLPVFIKVLNKEYPSEKELKGIKNEFETAKYVKGIKGVIAVYELIRVKNSMAIVMEDIGGESLSSILLSGPMDISFFLTTALYLTETLEALHHKRIIHKDLKPSNIVINRETGEVRIIDFSISSRFSPTNPSLGRISHSEGTPAYISPEQTGRINWSFDYRSDFYSLGVTFFQMLTGRLPFEIKDPAKLMNAHINTLPPFVNEINHLVPEVISRIVNKLLAKSASHRYQSAYGIRADLKRCFDEYTLTANVSLFPIGTRDVSDIFRIPDKLYGREDELGDIINIFVKTSQGSKEILFITGGSGIGKSALVNQMHIPLVKKQTFCFTGKFDYLKRNIPYTGIIQAFSSLAEGLLTESEETLGLWREKILTAVEDKGRVITDVIPELKIILGEQPALEPLPPGESQVRFNQVFESFVEVLASKEHPLVLFLDDLQWADDASLQLLHRLFLSPYLNYFLFFGAYRDNEIDDSHPVITMREELSAEGVSWMEKRLTPLHKVDIEEMLAETLHCEFWMTEDLAALVHRKTGGNPFFVREFLKTLYREGFIVFKNTWVWDLQKIRDADITENVVELMADKIKELPDSTWKVIRVACCMGVKFSLAHLALVCEKTEEECLVLLEQALQEGMIILKGEQISFVHDRVREGAYSILEKTEQLGIHYIIGKSLMPPEGIEGIDEELIFIIVNQLNLARKLLNDDEKNILVKLNLKACRIAKLSATYKAALNFIIHSNSIALLPKDIWETDYALALDLFTERGEVEFLNSNYNMTDLYIKIVLHKARSIMDKIKVYHLKLETMNNKGLMLDATALGLKVLKQLGVSLPEKPGAGEQLKGILFMAGSFLTGKMLSNYIEMRDKRIIAAMDILEILLLNAYRGRPELFPVIARKMISLSLRYGIYRQSAMAFIFYALWLCRNPLRLSRALEWTRKANEMIERYNTGSLVSMAYLLIALMISPWTNHMKESLTLLEKSFKKGYQSGEMTYSTNARSWWSLVFPFFLGEDLSKVERKSEKYFPAILKTKHTVTILHNRLYHYTMEALRGNTLKVTSLSSDDFQEKAALEKIQTLSDLNLTFTYYALKLFLHCLYEEYRQALEYAEKCRPLIRGAEGALIYPFMRFFQALALGALCRQEGKTGCPGEFRKILRQFRLWSHNCPANFKAQYLLLQAESWGMRGKNARAMILYDKAIKAARHYDFIHLEALAGEWAGKFYQHAGLEINAQAHLKEASHRYGKWGALAKQKAVKEKYHLFLESGIMNPSLLINLQDIHTTDLTNHDIKAILKTTRDITDEIRMDKLLTKIMHTVISNAGAQRGVFLMENEGEWFIEAIGGIGEDDISIIDSKPLDEPAADLIMPVSIIHYVIRTKKILMCNDTFKNNHFEKDPYIERNNPRAFLCIPLITRGNIISVIYLENSRYSNIFTDERSDILKAIAAQAAISIKNARLYQKAITDSLTGLFIRRYFDIRLAQEFNRAQRYDRDLSLVIFDADNFKEINDEYGHQAGDMVLIRIAEMMRNISRASDLACRYGGEEFAVILPETNEEEAMIFAEKVRNEVEKMVFSWKKLRIYRTLSGGLASFKANDPRDGKDMVNMADEALYLAKKQGRNRVVSGSMLHRLPGAENTEP